jgi:trigger factor
MTQKNYANIVLNSLPEREMEIVGQITAEKMSLLREKALQKVKAEIEIDGFRKGNAPETLVAQKVGEMRLLEEAAEIALSEEYPNILEEHNIDAIGRPEITVTKIGLGAPLEFKVKTALLPSVKLGDYKKIAAIENKKEVGTTEISEKEIDDTVLNIRRNMAHQMMHEKGGSGANEHSHGEIKDEDLPPIDENFLKVVGDFKSEADLREKIRQNIGKEKEMKERDKRRTDILEKIMAESKIEMPKIIVEGELQKMLAQFKDDLSRSGVPYEEYLKHIKKSEDDLKKDWRETAEKRAKSQIILNTVAKDENIAPKEEDIKKEMENILANFKDADRFRVRMYVETLLTNDLVFKFLEEQK